MELFEQPVTVTLTAAQWLSVQCALSDAWTHNEAQYPETTRGIIALKRVLQAQTGAAIDAAARQVGLRYHATGRAA